MKRTWIYLINTFLVVTKNSFVLAQKILQFHLNALSLVSTDVFYKPLYDKFKPIADSFDKAFTNWKVADTTQQSFTQKLINLIDDLSKNQIESWDVDIQVLYKKKTNEYKALLPKMRKPFQNGTQLERLQAVRTLSVLLEKEPKLTEVKKSVDAFLDSFDTLYETQKQSIQATDKLVPVLEAIRVKICVELYRNLGLLMAHFAETPEDAGVYFPLAFLRPSAQVSFTNSVKALKTRFIAKRTLLGTDTITIFNTGDGPLTFYFAQKKGDIPSAKAGFTIAANDIQSITADQLGDVNLKFIMVYNADANIVGHYQFDID
jgi:hypothetical protein